MWIPSQYIGTWRGKVEDEVRVNEYDGEIQISADEVKTTYEMSHGQRVVKITGLSQSNDCILLKEEVKGMGKATLLLYLDSKGDLRCVWRFGKKCAAEAAMKRV